MLRVYETASCDGQGARVRRRGEGPDREGRRQLGGRREDFIYAHTLTDSKA